MKQLTCEMCGSTDLLKQEGVFVCQTCGTKYSVEEAKKMMIEGTVEVTGTVQVDKTNQVKGYLDVFESAYKGRDGNTAYEYANKAIEAAPENPDVWVAKIKALSLIATGDNNRMDEIKAAVEKIKNCINDSDEALLLVRITYIDLMIDLTSDFNKYCSKNYYRTIRDNVEREIEKKRFRSKKKVITTYFVHFLSDYRRIPSQMIDYLVDNSKLFSLCTVLIGQLELGNDTFINCNAELTGMNRSKLSGYKTHIEEIRSVYDPAKEKLSAMRITQYWAEHAEEKQQLEAEKETVISKIEELKKQIDVINSKNAPQIGELKKEREGRVPAEDKLASLKSRIKELESQRDSLGFFKGKQKKELQEIITEEYSKINSLTSEIEVQKQQLLSRVNQEISVLEDEGKEIKAELANLQTRVSEIDTELTKPRSPRELNKKE